MRRRAYALGKYRIVHCGFTQMERVRTFAANAVQADDIFAMGLRFVR